MAPLLVRGTRLFAKTLFYVFLIFPPTTTTTHRRHIPDCRLHTCQPHRTRLGRNDYSWPHNIQHTKQGTKPYGGTTNGGRPDINPKNHSPASGLCPRSCFYSNVVPKRQTIESQHTEMTQFSQKQSAAPSRLVLPEKAFRAICGASGCICFCHAMLPPYAFCVLA